MMMNIFNSFNPINFSFLSFLYLNLFSTIFFISMLLQKKFLLFFKMMSNFISMDFNKINKNNMTISILLMLIFFNIILNLSNLIPFSFCLNSQLNLFFFSGLIMWFSCILYSLINLMNKFFSHLTPMGCPVVLSPFMVLIELVSLIIRPITLSVRMSANMLAGHLLIHLLTEFIFFLSSNNNLSMFLLMNLSLLVLNLLEIGVSLIQPYIFCTLLNMYLCENK